jgi:hypothetical protein
MKQEYFKENVPNCQNLSEYYDKWGQEREREDEESPSKINDIPVNDPLIN